MAADGISRAGTTSEERFIELTGATRAPKAALGDACLDGRYVEVKKATSTTINQVRAVKYLPLVIHRPANFDLEVPERWWVVPAHDVVRLIHAKNGRGQHTENAYESATLSTKHLADEHEVDAPKNLNARVIRAIRESDEHAQTRRAMEKIRDDAVALAHRAHDEVRQALVADGALEDDSGDLRGC